ncbi:MAG: O-antigen ligase family protein [Candidatus Hydrothermales bacterium]
MLEALKVKVNKIFIFYFTTFVLFFLLFGYLLLETNISLILVGKVFIFLSFLLILPIGNFFRNVIIFLPLSLILKLSINFNYIVSPLHLKPALSNIVLPFKMFNLFVLIFIFFLFLYFLSGNKLKEKVPFFNFLIILSSLNFLSILWSLKKDYAFLNSFMFLINSFYYFIGFLYFKEKKDLNLLLLSLLIFLVFNFLISFFQYFLPDSIIARFWKVEIGEYYWSLRVKGVFYHSNSYSAFINLALIMILSFILYSESRLLKYSLIFILFSAVFTIFLTFSRAGYLSLFLSIYFFCFFYLLKKGKAKILIFYTILTIILFAIFLFIIKLISPSIYLRFESILWGRREISILIRTIFWKEAIKIFINNPIKGLGSGQFAFTDFSQIHLHAHNAFLNFLVELGILGFIVFIVFLYKIFRFLLDIFRKTNEREIFLIIGLITGWISIIFQLFFDYYWLNAIYDMEIKFFFLYILITILLTKFYFKEKLQIP